MSEPVVVGIAPQKTPFKATFNPVGRVRVPARRTVEWWAFAAGSARGG